MIDKLYFRFVRRLITSKDEQNQFSGGLWPRLIRETAAAKCSGQTGKIIELGCGEGLFLIKLVEKNPRAAVYGIDLNSDHIGQAQTRLTGHLNAHLSQGNALKTDFAGEYFDWVFCLNVIVNLRHMSDVEQLFAEASRILKPGGKFVFDIKNSFSPIIQAQYRLAPLYDTGIKVPLKSYSRFSIEKQAEKHGFRLLSMEYLGFPKNFLAPVVFFMVEKK